jgi:hypothetical protein
VREGWGVVEHLIWVQFPETQKYTHINIHVYTKGKKEGGREGGSEGKARAGRNWLHL